MQAKPTVTMLFEKLSYHNIIATYRLVETLDEGSVLLFETTVSEATTSTRVNEVNQLRVGELQEMLEVNSAVRELAESALLGSASGNFFL